MVRRLWSILSIPCVAILSLALILGAALFVGWILTLLLPFSLFEGTLLAQVALMALGAVGYLIAPFFLGFARHRNKRDA